MIELILYFGTEVVFVRVQGHKVSFATGSGGGIMGTIDNMGLNYDGVIKEFPELIGERNWRKEAIAKFKDKLKSLGSEDEIAKYVVEDLRKFGYTPKFRQKNGHRREAIQ